MCDVLFVYHFFDQKQYNIKGVALHSRLFQGFIARCYKLVGKNYSKSADLKIITIQDKTNNPLKPKITISYDSTGKNIQSVLIEYNNNSYKVDPKNITVRDDGSYTIETPLFKNKSQQSLYTRMVYNPIVENTVASFQGSAVGQALGSKLLDKAQELLTSNSQAATTFLSINYDPAAEKTTTTTRELSGPYVKIATTKEYSNNSIQPTKQTITLPKTPGDLYSPDITIESSLDADGKTIINSGSIKHFDPLHNRTIAYDLQPKNVEFDPATGDYKIVAEFAKQPAESSFAEKRAWVLSQFPKEQQPQVTEMLDILEPIVSGFSGEVYNQVFQNLDTILTTASQAKWSSIALTSFIQPLLTPEIKAQYEQFKAYMLSDYPTSIQAVRLEGNFLTGKIADRVVKRMAKGAPTETTLQYTTP